MKLINYSFLLLIVAFLNLIPGPGNSQTLPPHQLTVYDSTVTGYYFLATKKMTESQAGYTHKQIVLDHKGNIIYYHPVRGGDFTMQPNGQVTCARGQQWMIMDSTFTVVDSVSCIGYRTDAHEIQILPNHHFLLLGLQDSVMDLSSYHYFKHNGTPGSTTALVTGSVIQELDSNKNLLFEWRTLDHLSFNSADTFFMFSPTVVDWSHSNALEMDTDGNILMSSRHLCEITKINRTTGAVMWRMGGKYNQFTFINDPYSFHGQHDIRRIANGHVTLVDNGHYVPSHGARGVEYELDEVNKTATLVWSYAYDSTLWSGGAGNCQQIGGGMKLVNNGHRSFGHHCFSIVDSLNNLVSEFQFLDTTVMYRVFFYRNLPWSFHRPNITCDIQGTSVYLKTTATYASYLWSTGATTATIQITTPGAYHVMVNYGEGFIVSEDFNVTNMSNPCYPIPTAAFSANNTTACKNSNVNFTDQSVNSPTSWSWSFPGGTPSGSTLQNPTVKYANAGTYSVTLTAGNVAGSGSVVKTNYITVKLGPASTITTSGSLALCAAGTSVLLSANTGAGLTHQWKKGLNDIAGATASTYAATTAGVYKVVVTNSNGCTKISNTLTVTSPQPIVIANTGLLDLCPGDSVKLEVPLNAGSTYQWKKNNVDIAGATSNVFYPHNAGDYKVKVISTACTKLSGIKTVTTFCNAKEGIAVSSGGVIIFPNPSSKSFNVALNSKANCTITLYDLMGKKIESHVVSGTDNFTFGENLNAGFYMCEIIYDNQKEFFKIVKVDGE
ncbi:MAG: aryl-sulfate sulfotransferase [Bacteroidia bacterium]